MTLEYNNIDKIAQRLSMLQTNVEAINDAYYSLYLADVEDDIELKQYGSNGTVSDYSPIASDIQILTEDLFIRQVANFQKTINSLVKHGTYSPNGILTSEFASQLYVNTRNKDMWVSLSANSNDSWQLIFSEEILGAHNRSAKAHEGYNKEVITVTDNYTGSATNVGTFNSESDLHNYSGELVNDDYAFVLNTTDDSLNAYKYVYSSDTFWQTETVSVFESGIDYDVTFDGNYFWALGDGNLLKSSDGETWETVENNLDSSCSWSKIGYGNETYIALATSDNKTVCCSSLNGIDWSSPRSLSNLTGQLPIGICYTDNDAFYVLIGNGTDHYSVYRSEDGTVWDIVGDEDAPNTGWYLPRGLTTIYPIYVPSLDVYYTSCLGYDSSATYKFNQMIGADLDTAYPYWSNYSAEDGPVGYAVYYGNGTAVLSSDGGICTTSEIDIDTSHTTQQTVEGLATDANFTGLTFGKDKLVAVSSTGKVAIGSIGYWSCIGTYKGSFSSLTELESNISTPSEGDFADVKDGDNRYVYIYRTNAWVNEYNVNNSMQLTSALARLHGDKIRPFYVKNVAEDSIYVAYTPEYATTATTMVYTGHKDQLFTENKQDIVSAINEINQRVEDGREALKNLTKEEDYSIVNGNYNSEGEADLMGSGVKINYYKRNVEEVGTFEIETSVVDNFSSESYLTFPNFTPSTNPWEIVFKFKTGADVITEQYIYACMYGSTGQYSGTFLELINGKLYAKGSTNGSDWDINIDSAWNIAVNTNYWSKVKFTGSQYEFYLSTNGYDYTLQGSYERTTPIIEPKVSRIGIYGNDLLAPFLGSIDLAGCYYSIGGMTSWTGISLVFTSSPEGVEYLPPAPSTYGKDNYSFYGFTGDCSESNARLALRSIFEQNYISSSSSAGFIVKYPRKFVLKNVKYYASVPSDALNASIFTTYRIEGYNYDTYRFQTIIETSGNSENVWNEAISTTNVISTDLYKITFLGQQATNGYASNIYLSGLRDLTQEDYTEEYYTEASYHYIPVGSIVNMEGVLSNFSSSNYATLPSIFKPANDSWEMCFKVTTGDNVSSEQAIFGAQGGTSGSYKGMAIIIYSGKAELRVGGSSSWKVKINGGTISENTTYYFRAKYNQSTNYSFEYSTNGSSWTTIGTSVTTTPINEPTTSRLGVYGNAITDIFKGTIDLKGCYIKINNQVWWEGVTYVDQPISTEDVDCTPEPYLDGIGTVNKREEIGESVYYHWQASQGCFGYDFAPSGQQQGFNSGNYMYTYGNYDGAGKVAYVTNTVIHIFENPLTAGTYKFKVAAGYGIQRNNARGIFTENDFNLYAGIDNQDVAIELPSGLVLNEWKDTQEFQVLEGSEITYIKVVCNWAPRSAYCGSGIVHLIKLGSSSESTTSYDFDYYSEEEISTIIQSKEYVGVGTYYINVDANSYVDIELVGGGGCRAYTDGGRDNYRDTAYAHHYHHCGGSGGYFKGTAFFSEKGILMVTVPEGKNYTRSIYDTYSYPWGYDDDGSDAVATFISTSGSITEVARARGGKRGYPEFHLGFYAETAGGTTSYNTNYIVNVEKAITGPNGYVYSNVFA